MKIRYRFVVLSLGFLLAGAADADAQKSYAIGLGGGASIPTGKFNDIQSTGASGTLFIAIGVPDLPLGVRFDGVYTEFGHKKEAVAPPTPANLRLLGLVGNLIFTFPGTAAKTYLLGGAGLYNVKPDTTGAKSENDFGFNGGIGAVFALGPLAAFVESRYHSISRKPADGGSIHFVPITLGFMF